MVNAILSDQIFDYEISSKNDKVLSSDFTVIINIFRKTSSRTHKIDRKQQQFPHPSGTLMYRYRLSLVFKGFATITYFLPKVCNFFAKGGCQVKIDSFFSEILMS